MSRKKSQRKKETREESPKEKGTENNELPSKPSTQKQKKTLRKEINSPFIGKIKKLVSKWGRITRTDTELAPNSPFP